MCIRGIVTTPNIPIPSSSKPKINNRFFPRSASLPPINPPKASPAMNVESKVDNAYVVEPRIIESALVHTTSYMSAAAPEKPKATRTIHLMFNSNSPFILCATRRVWTHALRYFSLDRKSEKMV
jgi:hypothetical protein